MAGSTPLILAKNSQQGIIEYHRQCYSLLNTSWNIREQMRTIDLSYMRENDFTVEQAKARISNRIGDPTKFQNVVVPIVMPQVEAAVAYQSAVFLTQVPLFGWVAPPGDEDSALQFQAIVEENSIRGAWVQQFMIWFKDLFKYNLGAIEVDWSREVTAAIETDVGFSTKQGKPKEVIWQGNCIKRWDLYNSFWDPRYKPTELYKRGEFAGTTTIMSRIELKKFINELPDKMVANIKDAFESGYGSASTGSGGVESYYTPQINPNALMNVDTKRSFDWLAWAGIMERPEGEMRYQNIYEVSTLYARIIPQDFRLRVPSANTPQVWKFIIINHQVLIYAERQTNAHGYIPVLFAQPNEDGLGYQTKSLATNAQPFQEVGSALINSAMAARRRAIGDRAIYNPLLISEVHVNSSSPIAKIPLRPAGYNKEISTAYYPIPFNDNTSGLALQELGLIQGFADKANGQNQTRQGQFIKGNKNNPEWEAIMANATSRDQMTSLLLEGQVFTPLKEILKINTIQYQAGITIFSPSLQKEVKIDPVKLRQSFVTYKVTDGLTPTAKVISGDALTAGLQAIMSSPVIGAAYNIGPLFSYLMKTQNADLTIFEKPPEQVAYEQAVAAWQQVIMQLAKQGVDPATLPPQPVPANYGYNPQLTQSSQGQQTTSTPQTGSQNAYPTIQ